MNKPIEEKVKDIVENNATLNIREKSEIICLIECYKGADALIKELTNKITRLEEEKKFLNDENEWLKESADLSEM